MLCCLRDFPRVACCFTFCFYSGISSGRKNQFSGQLGRLPVMWCGWVANWCMLLLSTAFIENSHRFIILAKNTGLLFTLIRKTAVNPCLTERLSRQRFPHQRSLVLGQTTVVGGNRFPVVIRITASIFCP